MMTASSQESLSTSSEHFLPPIHNINDRIHTPLTANMTNDTQASSASPHQQQLSQLSFSPLFSHSLSDDTPQKAEEEEEKIQEEQVSVSNITTTTTTASKNTLADGLLACDYLSPLYHQQLQQLWDRLSSSSSHTTPLFLDHPSCDLVIISSWVGQALNLYNAHDGRHDKQHRNHLLAMVTRLAETGSPAIHTQCVLTGLTEILLHATSQLHTQAHRVDAEDRQLCTLLWSTLTLLSGDPINHALLSRSCLLSTLLSYLDNNSIYSYTYASHTTQQQEQLPPIRYSSILQLQQTALTCLTILTQYYPLAYLQAHGHERLIEYISGFYTASQDVVQAEARLLAQDQCRMLQGLAVKAIRHALIGSRDYPADAVANCSPNSSSTITTDNTQECESRVLPVLLALALDGHHSLETRTDAVATLTLYIRYSERLDMPVLLSQQLRLVDNIASFLHQTSFMYTLLSIYPGCIVSVIELIWSCIVQHPEQEDRFIQKEGVEALMQLLGKATEELRPQILGCLADLLQNEQTVTRFHAWRCTPSMVSSTHPDLPSSSSVRFPPIAHSKATSTASGTSSCISAVALLVSWWPSDPLDSSSFSLSTALYAVLSAANFSLCQSRATYSQQAILSHIQHFPDYLQLSHWLSMQQQLSSSQSPMLPEDWQYIQSHVTRLRTVMAECLNKQQQCEQKEQEEQCVDLLSHLTRVNECRIMIQPKLYTTNNRGSGSSGSTGTGGSSTLLYPTMSMRHRNHNSLYGKYRTVPVMPVFTSPQHATLGRHIETHQQQQSQIEDTEQEEKQQLS